MSTEYYTNILYDTFIKDVKDIELQDPEKPFYTMPHKRMYFNGNYIWVFKEIKDRSWREDCAIFERRGANNPTEIFNLILKQFSNIEIKEEMSLIKWPECGGYDPILKWTKTNLYGAIYFIQQGRTIDHNLERLGIDGWYPGELKIRLKNPGNESSLKFTDGSILICENSEEKEPPIFWTGIP